eukprot:TRINITY_DN999_c0_g1_i1.p1 TRINITY_DN999_c0_g1~~TRINITY_DN999_c0_g1_i1.p1  ORF type:complete len:1210 (-),score=469.20 TRINITY_DN999_c0_g1_i1:738-3905(-)
MEEEKRKNRVNNKDNHSNSANSNENKLKKKINYFESDDDSQNSEKEKNLASKIIEKKKEMNNNNADNKNQTKVLNDSNTAKKTKQTSLSAMFQRPVYGVKSSVDNAKKSPLEPKEKKPIEKKKSIDNWSKMKVDDNNNNDSFWKSKEKEKKASNAMIKEEEFDTVDVDLHDDDFDTIEVDQLIGMKKKVEENKIKMEEEKTRMEKERNLKEEKIATDKVNEYLSNKNNSRSSNQSLISPPKKTNTKSQISPNKILTPSPKSKFTFTEEVAGKSLEDSSILRSGNGHLFTGSSSLPPSFVDLTIQEHYNQFFVDLMLKSEERGCVCIGILYRYGLTSFRPSSNDTKKYQPFPGLESMIGMGFLPSRSKKGFYLPISLSEVLKFEGDLREKVDEEKENETIGIGHKLELLRKITVNGDIGDKICFEGKEILKFIFECFPKIKVCDVVDPKIAAWIYEPELKSYAFNELLHLHVQILDDSRSSASHLFFQDSLNCIRLWNSLKSKLEEEKLTDSFIDQEMKTVYILARMELEGIGFDSASLMSNAKLLKKRTIALSQQANQILGRDIMLSSPQQVAKAIFIDLGLESNRGKKGMVNHQSTSEKVLQTLKDAHPFVNIVLEYRHVQKLISTYLDNLDKKSVKPHRNHYPELDQHAIQLRMFTNWQQTNTATGRLSSAGPNLQNIPKLPLSIKDDEEILSSQNVSSEEMINIRDSFYTADGYTFLSFDYSQIEMRILGHVSNDTYLLQFFKDEQDIHRLIASRWLGKKPEEITDKERDHAKRIVYGILYGMGPNALADIIKVSVMEATKFIKTFLGRFPGVDNFITNTQAFARKNLLVKTLVGRRRLLPGINSIDKEQSKRCERQSVNTIIQGTAADIVKLAMIRVQEAIDSLPLLKDTKMLLQIHDELFFELPDNSKIPEITATICNIMENVIDLSVELPVRVNIGKRWGSMKSVEEKSYRPLLGKIKNKGLNFTPFRPVPPFSSPEAKKSIPITTKSEPIKSPSSTFTPKAQESPPIKKQEPVKKEAFEFSPKEEFTQSDLEDIEDSTNLLLDLANME